MRNNVLFHSIAGSINKAVFFFSGLHVSPVANVKLKSSDKGMKERGRTAAGKINFCIPIISLLLRQIKQK